MTPRFRWCGFRSFADKVRLTPNVSTLHFTITRRFDRNRIIVLCPIHQTAPAEMPKAEVGSTKWQANNMKMKGLQRLRWFCQPCGKQCRDENGFKQHTMSEGHVRTMLSIGEDPRKFISNYSSQFQRDFLSLLRTAHGEKKVHANHFYNEYISDKQHVHMNSTRWASLTEFVKHLGRDGICRVEEGERGLEIAWIDQSPEAIKRKEASQKRNRMAKGDEEREARRLEEQIKRAEAQRPAVVEDHPEPQPGPASVEGATAEAKDQPVSFSLSAKPTDEPVSFSLSKPSDVSTSPMIDVKESSAPSAKSDTAITNNFSFGTLAPTDSTKLPDTSSPKPGNAVTETPNPFKSSKSSNPFKSSKSKTKTVDASSQDLGKKMSQAEMIMRREMEQSDRHGNKRQRRT